MSATPDLIAAYTALCQAREGYCRADAFYDGSVGEVFASEKIKRLLRKAGVEDIEDLNYAKIPVDTVANRLQVQSVSAARRRPAPGSAPVDTAGPPTPATQAGGTGTPEDRDLAAANAWLAHLWDRNQLDAETPGLHLDTSKHGDGYLIVWPVTDESGNVVDVDTRVNSAHTVRVLYDPEDPLRKAFAIKSWTYDSEGGKEVTRATLYYPDRVERWITTPGAKPTDPKAWDRYSDDRYGEADIPNPWGEVPVYHLRNARPYGTPEHKGAYGPQQLIHKLVVSHAATIDYQSFPQRYFLVDPKADDPTGNLIDPFHPEDDDDDPEDAGSSQLDADPSAVWKLHAARSAGQFPAADPDTFLRPLERYVTAVGELTDTPQHQLRKSSGEMPSGAALRILDAPTVNKVTNRQDLYGAAEGDALALALRMLGYDDLTVTVHWRPAQVVSDTEGWQVVAAKIANGVSVKQALTETGYPAEQVDEWLSGADDTVDFARRIALLGQIATATQALGAAATLGVLDPEQVQQVVVKVLGDLLPDGEQPHMVDHLPPMPPPARQGAAGGPGMFGG